MELLSTGEVAKVLNLSADRVRQLNRSGVLPAVRLAGGTRVFERSTVEALKAQRDAKLGHAA